MATTNAEPIPTPQTNGVIEDGYDEDDKMKMRPADIDADMREMERRKRVELIMNSRLFREELERIIESQMRDGNNSAGLLQQISDMVGSKYNNHFLRNASCAVPINDIRGLEAMGFVKGEKILRCKLAALFRLIDLYGWSQNIYNHVTARLSHQEEHFLVNPYGLLYSEVTASSLAKVDMQGGVIESGTTNFNVSVAGFKLHAAIYAFRPDLKCIIHLHTPSVLAISSLKDCLLPLCQEAVVIGEVSLYAYTGTPTESEERDKIARSLGPNNKVIFLTNHGALCCGETIEETFFNAYNIVSACETQLKVLPLGKDNLLLLSDEARKSMYDAARKMPENVTPANSNATSATTVSEKRWRVGGLEFEALMRMLDNAGFRTGYIYRTPLIKGELPRPRNDVEVPPAVSSLGYLFEEEELYNKGAWRKHFGNKGNDRIRWLNSPNVYQKVEILETGTTDPRKITKWVGPNNEEWVAEGSPSHTSTPVKIENALQFVPKNTNPKEFKKLQQQIKDNRRADKITSGPQSHILEGVSWEEAKKLQDANMSGTSDQVILVGAASKGIIQREYQHNATVYKTPYAKNPFDAVTDEELENYKKDVNRKQRGSSYYDEDESDSLPVKGVTSETEDDSLAHETRLIRIQTSTAPKESRAEVVLSDDGKKSKSKFMQSLGSMLSLRRELASFVDKVGAMYTSVWEMRVFHPAARLIATIEVVSYPSENEKPIVVRLNVDGDDEIRSLDLESIVRSYRDKGQNAVACKYTLQRIAEELASKFENGNVFRRVVQSFDSSEVEITTFTEIRSPQKSIVERRSESPQDFSSSATTEDEDDAVSSPSSIASGLKTSVSLSSLTSCTGAEYEEWRAPPPPSLSSLRIDEGWRSARFEDVQELTTSFKSTSDDTSVENLTVIYCPTSGKSIGEENLSDDDASITDGMSANLVSDDSDTYSSYNDLDYDEHIPQTFQYSETAKFSSDLSTIYEEERDRSTSVQENETYDGIISLSHSTKISESSEGTEDVHSAFPLSGYESASTLETDSLELDDSTNVKLSFGHSEMTWTIDDLSSMDEAEESRALIIPTESDVQLAHDAEEGASFEHEPNESCQISCTEDRKATCDANEACLTEYECLAKWEPNFRVGSEQNDDCDIVKEEENHEALVETVEILHHSVGTDSDALETKYSVLKCGENEQIPFKKITAEERYSACNEEEAIENQMTSKSLEENECVKIVDSEVLNEDSEDRNGSPNWSPKGNEYFFGDQNITLDEVSRSDSDSIPLHEKQNNIAFRNDHLTHVVFEHSTSVEECEMETGTNEGIGDSGAQNRGSSVQELYIGREGAITSSLSANNESSKSSPLEKTLLLSHLLLLHFQSYMQRANISVSTDTTSIGNKTSSAETVVVFPSPENVTSPGTLASDSSVHSVVGFGAALVNALENLEKSDGSQTCFQEEENESFQSSAASLVNSEVVSWKSETFDCEVYKAEYQQDRYVEQDTTLISLLENPKTMIPKGEYFEFGELGKPSTFTAENYVLDDPADLVPSLENSVETLPEQNSVHGEENCDQRKNSFEFDVPGGVTHHALHEMHTTVEKSTGSLSSESIHGEHLQLGNYNTFQREDQLHEGNISLSKSSEVTLSKESCDIDQIDKVLTEGTLYHDQDVSKKGNEIFDENPVSLNQENSKDSQSNEELTDTDEVDEIIPQYKGNYDRGIDQSEEELLRRREDSEEASLRKESLIFDREPTQNKANYYQDTVRRKNEEFEDETTSFPVTGQLETTSPELGSFNGGDVSPENEPSVNGSISISPTKSTDGSENRYTSQMKNESSKNTPLVFPIESSKKTRPETESLNLRSCLKPDRDTSQEESQPQRNAEVGSGVNPSVACQYDYNQNEIPVDKNESANTTSDCGDFKLTLSLHIEWDDKSTLPVLSSTESTPVRDGVLDDECSLRADESFDDFDVGASPMSPHRDIRLLYFKQNYPKFIQYSDFSPRINSKCKRTPRRKRGPAADSTNKGRRAHLQENSADSSGYRRYSELTADWPPHANQSTSAHATDASSTERPRLKSTCSSNFDCNLKIGARVRASTPKCKSEKVCTSPNRTSLEEFEFYESFFDTK